ncbi:MAG: aminotransferase class III-fold pyridoxal phosphate-dependent enzyme [Rhizobiales bacterium]|nr:aminotransferase class III-fold pyridoxal phosphate-dependent enzyme [Hyphomicrobiales bacterium]
MSVVHLERSLESCLTEMAKDYAAARPLSRAAHENAEHYLPGGNTRSVLFFNPFPLFIARGSGAEVEDLDGHVYLDCVGEFSAGLYGHSDPVIADAISGALAGGTVLSGANRMEAELAAILSARFKSMERTRFCNSGTEANLLAIMTARAATGRERILAFHEAYHGSLLSFPKAGNPLNMPFDCTLADYNDVARTAGLIRQIGSELAAVIVEPILGAGGNIPGSREFLQALRDATSETGAILIFDEVKTSRCGAGGVQGRQGIVPDMTTIGKYVGGGLACGAFGGRADLMSIFDPKKPNALRHAGTFNNNVCTLAAGIAGLTKVFTAARADAFHATCETFRVALNGDLAARNAPGRLSGFGSLFTLHFSGRPVATPSDLPPRSRAIAQLFHLFCMSRGVLVASRGDIFMTLPMGPADREKLRGTILAFMDEYEEVIRAETGE